MSNSPFQAKIGFSDNSDYFMELISFLGDEYNHKKDLDSYNKCNVVLKISFG